MRTLIIACGATKRRVVELQALALLAALLAFVALVALNAAGIADAFGLAL